MWTKSILVFTTVLLLIGFAVVVPVSAQLTTVECGSIVTGEFTQNDQLHTYRIMLNALDQVTLSVIGANENVKVGAWLYSPSDVFIGGSNGGQGTIPRVSTSTFQSGELSATGTYTIRVQNGAFDTTDVRVNPDYESDSIGSYQMLIDCVLADGTYVSAGTAFSRTPTAPLDNVVIDLPVIRSQSITSLQCGQLLSSEFVEFAQLQRYSVDIAGDDQEFWVTVTPIGDYLRSAMAIFDPAGVWVGDATGYVRSSPSLQIVPRGGGTYLVVVANHYLAANQSDYWLFYPERRSQDYNGNVGLYVIGVGCRTSDGTILNPGDVPYTAQAVPTAVQSSVTPNPSELEISTACPNSPQPRLTVGLTGRVTPGDPNNLRTEPAGTIVVGQIPAGGEFTILEGPVCGSNGLTFWQVQYGDLTGWTAEGRGTEYWLEPTQSGRG